MGGLNVTRDTMTQSGGTYGFVNSAALIYSKSGPGMVQFEWNLLGINDNYAKSGENVAAYFQGNKFSTGPTWGAVAEVSDTVGAGGGAWGLEVDNWTTGPDTGGRFGVGVLIGDAKFIRGINGYPTTSEGSYGITIGATGTTPWARWQHGLVIKDTSQTGIVLQGQATRGIWLQGTNAVGLDESTAEVQTAIRLKAGQKVCFNEYDTYCAKLDPTTQELVFLNMDTPLMRLTPGGHLHILGQIWQNGQ
jgi:co-chaperonin GroES (HSP10)